MAKFQISFSGDFTKVLAAVETIVLDGSISATLEDAADYTYGDTRCSIRVFERYSHFGGNRVSMSVTLFQPHPGEIRLCAITSGGSQAMFFKVNTIGEEAFLDTLRCALDRIKY
jgi:hypothetical protein